MKYEKIKTGRFISRPNRFIAAVDIEGEVNTVHVKNTGRCRELLLPGSDVILYDSQNPLRKTRYDLVTVQKKGLGAVNIDSQAPNALMKEWLLKCGLDQIKPEYTYGDSRIDFFCRKLEKNILIEVKGCTLEIDGIGYFPDAPTERGTKHIGELCRAIDEGYDAYLAFVIQMNGITEVRPNITTDPRFSSALLEAEQKGVKILYLTCRVDEDEVIITSAPYNF